MIIYFFRWWLSMVYFFISFLFHLICWSSDFPHLHKWKDVIIYISSFSHGSQLKIDVFGMILTRAKCAPVEQINNHTFNFQMCETTERTSTYCCSMNSMRNWSASVRFVWKWKCKIRVLSEKERESSERERQMHHPSRNYSKNHTFFFSKTLVFFLHFCKGRFQSFRTCLPTSGRAFIFK